MLKKGDLYFPSKEIKKKSWANDEKIYEEAKKNPVKFWEKLAQELFWFAPWKKAFNHNPPFFQWFVGGKINITSNIFEHNLLGWEKIKNKTALIWIPEPIKEKEKKITYQELYQEVNKLANAFKKIGVKKGDKVGIYLPMIPEALITMLACARIGAVHSVIFSAFSAQALKSRLLDCEAKILVTCDGYYRKGQIINLKNSADEGIKGTKIKKVLVVKRAKIKEQYSSRVSVKASANKIFWDEKKDIWFHELIRDEKDSCPPKAMDAEDLMFVLYTSGSTGKPKGCMHVCGGYAVQAYWTGKWIFNLHEDDIMWCTSDIGWITGHSYAVYSPLLNGATTIFFEGMLNFPVADRWAQILEKHKVTVFYTAPTAIRIIKKETENLKNYQFKDLRILGSVGEPIDETTWNWYFKEIGKKRCPIVDTWWQTETGGILISSLPGIGPFKPTYTGLPLPGIKISILNERGKETVPDEEGNLVILPPFSPGLLRGIYKNPEKYQETYWKQYGKKIYFTSDGAWRDKNKMIRIFGRVDDVIKVAGHRISTGEMENALSKHPLISESAVIGIPDEIKGQTPIFFVVLKETADAQKIKEEIINLIRREIGPIAQPKEIYFIDDLPKTRSGKIMRRILRKLFSDEELGDLSTLANPESVEKIKQKIKKP